MLKKLFLLVLLCLGDGMRLSRFYSISRGNSLNNMTLRHFNKNKSTGIIRNDKNIFINTL